MRITLFFPENSLTEKRNQLVDAADTCARTAFGTIHGNPSVHGICTLRPTRDTSTIVCVVQFKEAATASDAEFFRKKEAFLQELFSALLAVEPERDVRIESPDGYTLRTTWNESTKSVQSA